MNCKKKKKSESSALDVLPIKNKISFIDFKPQLMPDKNLPNLILFLTFLNKEMTVSIALPSATDEQNRFCTNNKNPHFLYSF